MIAASEAAQSDGTAVWVICLRRQGSGAGFSRPST